GRSQRPAAYFWRRPWSYSTSPFPIPSWEDDWCLRWGRILLGSSKCRRCHADQRVEPLPAALAALAFAACSAKRGSASKPIQPQERTRPCDDTSCGDSLHKSTHTWAYFACNSPRQCPRFLLLLLGLGPLPVVFRHLNFNRRVAWLYRERVRVDSLRSHAAPAVATQPLAIGNEHELSTSAESPVALGRNEAHQDLVPSFE